MGNRNGTELSCLKMRKNEAGCWLGDIVTLKFTRIMGKCGRFLKQIPKPLINVNHTGKLLEGREHKS